MPTLQPEDDGDQSPSDEESQRQRDDLRARLSLSNQWMSLGRDWSIRDDGRQGERDSEGVGSEGSRQGFPEADQRSSKSGQDASRAVPPPTHRRRSKHSWIERERRIAARRSLEGYILRRAFRDINTHLLRWVVVWIIFVLLIIGTRACWGLIT